MVFQCFQNKTNKQTKNTTNFNPPPQKKHPTNKQMKKRNKPYDVLKPPLRQEVYVILYTLTSWAMTTRLLKNCIHCTCYEHFSSNCRNCWRTSSASKYYLKIYFSLFMLYSYFPHIIRWGWGSPIWSLDFNHICHGMFIVIKIEPHNIRQGRSGQIMIYFWSAIVPKEQCSKLVTLALTAWHNFSKLIPSTGVC